MIDFELGLDEGTRDITALVDPLNPLDAKRKFDTYDAAIASMLDRAKAHAVTDDATNHEAVAMASQIKAIANKIENLRVEIVSKPNKFVKAVNTFAKNFSSKLTDGESILKSKINAFQREEERRRIEAQRIANEESKRLQAEIDKAAAELSPGVENGYVPILVQPRIIGAEKVTRTDSGSASLRKDWKWRLIDFSQVPDEYKTTQDTKINQAVRAGVRNIPGIEIYEASTTVIRSSGIDENWKF